MLMTSSEQEKHDSNPTFSVKSSIRGHAKYIHGQCNSKIEVTKKSLPIYNSRVKSVSPVQMINEKGTDPI